MGNGAYTRDDCPDMERILGVVRKLAEEYGKVYISKRDHRSYLSHPPQPAVVYLFQAGVPFPTENAKGTAFDKFIQRIKICTFFVMEILDKPSQILNVRNTTSQ